MLREASVFVANLFDSSAYSVANTSSIAQILMIEYNDVAPSLRNTKISMHQLSTNR
jgi:hypothetical protein